MNPDENGKPIEVEADESLLPAWTKLAAELVDGLRELSAQPEYRSRSLSLAITYLEDAIYRLRDAANDVKG